MPTVQLSFPVWVRHHEGTYQLSPLLFTGPVGQHERYDKAERHLRGEVIKSFRREQQLNRSNLHEALWYLFDPPYQFMALDLELRYGSRYFSGKVAVAWFPYLGGTVVVLPAFDRHMFVLKGTDLSRSDLVAGVSEQIQLLARQHRKKHGEPLPLADKTTGKGEHCTTLEQAVFVREEKLSLQTEMDRFFFQFFRAHTEFEGRMEVHRVGHALNDLFPDELQRAYYRDEWVEKLSHFLLNRENVPLVLLGPRKGGKTTLLHEVMHRYLSQQRSEALYRCDHLWYVDPTRLIAGMSVVGAWQRRLESIIAFVQRPLEDFSSRRDMLYFSNVVALFRVGKSAQNSMTLSDVLKPYLQKRQLQVVIEATPEAWDVVSEVDRAFTDLFQVFRIEDPDPVDTLRIVSQLRSQLEKNQPFAISHAGLRQLIALERSQYREESLVGRIAEGLQQLATRYRQPDVGVDHVMRAFNTRTHFNPLLTDLNLAWREDSIRAYFEANLIGQSQVVEALVNLVAQIKAQLHPPQRPYGSLLFIGPTGVGKTQAAKVLADYLFTHEDRLLRFDMNEYIDPGAVSRLVGDAYTPEGQLTSKVRYNSPCVLLLDEIEKAHPDVHNLLLQVLDEGRLTDALGQVTNFRSTVIIMTSNLGADRIGKSIRYQASEDEAPHTYTKALRNFFRPEFINRIDHTLVFRPLAPQAIEGIAFLQIKQLLRRQGLARREVTLDVAPEVLRHLAGRGFDPKMGGRALKRQIEKDLVALLADQLVEIPPHQPMLMHMAMEDGAITARLTALVEVDPSPPSILPSWHGTRSAQQGDFEALLEGVATLRLDIQDACDAREEEHETDLLTALRADAALNQLFDMKAEVRELEDELHELIRQYGLRRNLVLTGGHFRVKSLGKMETKLDEKATRPLLKDRANREAVDDYLQQLSQAATQLVDKGTSLYLHFQRRQAWLARCLSAYEAHGLEHYVLRLTHLNEADHMARGFLENLYARLGLERSLMHDPHEGETYRAWLARRQQAQRRYPGYALPHHQQTRVSYLFGRGFGLSALLTPEQGVHRVDHYQTRHLILVEGACVDAATWQDAYDRALAGAPLTGVPLPQSWPQQLPIVRHCDVRADVHEQTCTTGTFLDLRTQWLFQAPVSEEDFRLLFLAGAK